MARGRAARDGPLLCCSRIDPHRSEHPHVSDDMCQALIDRGGVGHYVPPRRGVGRDFLHTQNLSRTQDSRVRLRPTNGYDRDDSASWRAKLKSRLLGIFATVVCALGVAEPAYAASMDVTIDNKLDGCESPRWNDGAGGSGTRVTAHWCTRDFQATIRQDKDLASADYRTTAGTTVYW